MQSAIVAAVNDVATGLVYDESEPVLLPVPDYYLKLHGLQYASTRLADPDGFEDDYMHTKAIPTPPAPEVASLHLLLAQINDCRMKMSRDPLIPRMTPLDPAEIIGESKNVITYVLEQLGEGADTLLSERSQLVEMEDIRDRLVASRQKQEARLLLPQSNITIDTFISYSNSLYKDLTDFITPQSNYILSMQSKNMHQYTGAFTSLTSAQMAQVGIEHAIVSVIAAQLFSTFETMSHSLSLFGPVVPDIDRIMRRKIAANIFGSGRPDNLPQVCIAWSDHQMAELSALLGPDLSCLLLGHRQFQWLVKRLWILHVLSLVYFPQPTVIRFERGDDIQSDFCELADRCSGARVACTVWPGFEFAESNAVMKCKVVAGP